MEYTVAIMMLCLLLTDYFSIQIDSKCVGCPELSHAAFSVSRVVSLVFPPLVQKRKHIEHEYVEMVWYDHKGCFRIVSLFLIFDFKRISGVYHISY